MPMPASKEIIAVDIDDVVFPFVPNFVKFLGKHAINIEEEHFTSYDLSQIYGIEKSKVSKLVTDFIRSQHMLSTPIAGSVRGIGKLSENYKIIVLTARDRQFEELTKKWFAQHFSQTISEIHIVGDPYAAGGSPKAKAETCVQMGVDYLIDDLPYYINEAADAGIEGLLFGDYAWNRKADVHQNVTRVKDWGEVLEYFGEKG